MNRDQRDALLVGKLPPSRRQFVQRPPELIFCASVRAGFVPASRRDLFRRMEPLIAKECPFTNLPETSAGRWGQGLTAAKMPNCTWLLPRLVANFSFLEWTASEHLRHSHFVGLRDDKAAITVVRET